MSTVDSLLVDVLGRIDENDAHRLIPALNRAIRTIAKRLYVHQSDIVKGSLSVGVYAEDVYTAATVAFVNGGEGVSDTITDSASQLVIEGFVANMPIVTTHTTNLGPFKIASVAAGTITLASTETLTTQSAGASYTITSQDDFGYLPSDFWGLMDRPYISGKTWELLPLPSQDVKIQYTSAGVSRYYEVRNNRLYVIPATSSDITIYGDYFKKPTEITSVADTIPFDELFDDAIGEWLVKIMAKGLQFDTADAAVLMHQMMVDAVDLVLVHRPKKAPPQMPGGIDWNTLMEGEEY